MGIGRKVAFIGHLARAVIMAIRETATERTPVLSSMTTSRDERSAAEVDSRVSTWTGD